MLNMSSGLAAMEASYQGLTLVHFRAQLEDLRGHITH
jgi:hypothetical protein